VSHTMLDLLIILIPHLPASPAKALFNAASTGNLIENSDAAIQKKSYRILTRLIELDKASALQGEGFDQFVQKLVDVSASIGPGAQRVSRPVLKGLLYGTRTEKNLFAVQDRMLLLIALVPVLPKTRLHLIPTLVTEAVLGTKEVNEKARNAAFDLLVVMAKKMSEGGVVDQKLLKGDDADLEKDDEGMDNAAPAGNGKGRPGISF
jgi:ribosomal RNA-processing protein 12